MFTNLKVTLDDSREVFLQPGKLVIKNGVIEHLEMFSVVYNNGNKLANSTITPLLLDSEGHQVIVEGIFVEPLPSAPKTKLEFFEQLKSLGIDEESALKAAEASDYAN